MTATVTPYGDGALLIDVDDIAAAHRLVAVLETERSRGRAPAGVGESVVGFGNVVVLVDPGVGTVDEVGAWLQRVARDISGPGSGGAGAGGGADGRRVVIPVAFDGPDLAEVAGVLGVSVDAVAGMLCGVGLQVAFLGFSPGFPYLTGLPLPLAGIPRRSTPRPSVPAGSVAVAGGFASVYPTATPGGWALLGRTPLSLFDPERPPYVRLRPGDQVRFIPAEVSLPAAVPPARARRGAAPGPAFAEVVEPGLLSLIQDAGRRSSAGLGVPRAGPADPEAMRLANRLMGNADDAPVIEVTAAGPTLRFSVATHLAAVAASPDPDGVELRVDGRPVGSGVVVPVGPGQTVAVGRVRTGLRAYLAVSGGFDVPLQLGSRSYDVLCGLGPPPLAVGDRLGLGAPSRPRGLLLHPPAPRGSGRHREVRVLPGPHRLAPGRLPRLLATTWVVGETSNRIGIRLSGGQDRSAGREVAAVDDPPGGARVGREVDPAPAGPDAIPSTGMVTGAVQVPPDGRPIILMPDHATVGGYPVACCVISADFTVLGQLAPGDTVSLVAVDATAAGAARRQWERSLDERVSGWFPTAAGT